MFSSKTKSVKSCLGRKKMKCFVLFCPKMSHVTYSQLHPVLVTTNTSLGRGVHVHFSHCWWGFRKHSDRPTVPHFAIPKGVRNGSGEAQTPPPFSSVSGGEPVDSDSHDTFAWPQDTSAHQCMPCNTLSHPIGLPLAQGWETILEIAKIPYH